MHFISVNSGRSRISQTGDANLQGRGANLLFLQNFPQNCMKMKKKLDREGGGGAPGTLDPPMENI